MTKNQPRLTWTGPYNKSRIGLKREENMVFRGCEFYYTVSIYNYYYLSLFLALIRKFEQKSILKPRLAWTKPHKNRIGLKQEKNLIFKSREWYYIVSMYKYYQLTLFRVFIEKFDQKSNFQLSAGMSWTRPYKSRMIQNGKNKLFSIAESGIT